MNYMKFIFLIILKNTPRYYWGDGKGWYNVTDYSGIRKTLFYINHKIIYCQHDLVAMRVGK